MFFNKTFYFKMVKRNWENSFPLWGKNGWKDNYNFRNFLNTFNNILNFNTSSKITFTLNDLQWKTLRYVRGNIKEAILNKLEYLFFKEIQISDFLYLFVSYSFSLILGLNGDSEHYNQNLICFYNTSNL